MRIFKLCCLCSFQIYSTILITIVIGLHWWLSGKESACQYRRSLGQEDSLQKEMATHCSILAWEIPWTEEPGGLYSPWHHKEWDHVLATKQQQQQLQSLCYLLPMTCLSNNWKFVPFDHLHHFTSSPPLFLLTSSLFSDSMSSVFFSNSMYRWNPTVFFSVWLISLSIMPSSPSLQVAGFPSFSWSNTVTLYVYPKFSLSIYPSLNTWIVSVTWPL